MVFRCFAVLAFLATSLAYGGSLEACWGHHRCRCHHSGAAGGRFATPQQAGLNSGVQMTPVQFVTPTAFFTPTAMVPASGGAQQLGIRDMLDLLGNLRELERIRDLFDDRPREDSDLAAQVRRNTEDIAELVQTHEATTNEINDRLDQLRQDLESRAPSGAAAAEATADSLALQVRDLDSQIGNDYAAAQVMKEKIAAFTAQKLAPEKFADDVAALNSAEESLQQLRVQRAELAAQFKKLTGYELTK